MLLSSQSYIIYVCYMYMYVRCICIFVFLQFSMARIVQTVQLQSTNYFEEIKQKILSNNLVSDLPSQNVHIAFQESRNRSGSVPSHKLAQSDTRSISTMAGTIPSYKSDNRIQDIQQQKKSCALLSGKTQFKKLKKNRIQGDKLYCSLDKNGFIKSQSLDITSIKYYFIKVAAKMQKRINFRGMSVMKDVQDLVTIKSQKIHPLHCLFLMCLPLMLDQNVYQLQRYRAEGGGSTIKVSLVSGSESTFNDFRSLLYLQLWQNNLLALSSSQSISLLCLQKKQLLSNPIKQYEKACSEIEIKSLDSEEEIEIWQVDLMKQFKKCQYNVKRQIFSDSKGGAKPQKDGKIQSVELRRIERSSVSQITLQRILMHQIPICEFYLKLEMSNNCKLFQRKKAIIKKNTVKQVYEYLEIDLFLLQEKHFHNKQKISQLDFQDLPFASAVLYLNQLNIILSPMENVSKITHFINKLIQCNCQYKGKSEIMMDMDSQLPISIFCCLITTNTQIKPIVSFLHDYFETEDYFQQQNRALAALKAGLEYIREDWKIDQLQKK